MLEGNPITDQRMDFPASLGKDKEKKFKRTDDPEEAAKLLKELIDEALERADGNPEKLKRELDRLKRNSYQTFPNPQTMPDSFIRYLTNLEKTQGKAAANKRLLDYAQQNELNKLKSASVPTP